MNLVTGGAGFIGSHLAEALLRSGEPVRVIDDLSTGMRANLDRLWEVSPGVEVLEEDVRDAAERAVDGVERIFHLAALPSVARSVADPVATDRANVAATVRLLEAARKAGVRRIVYTGSSSAYGDPPGGSDEVVVKREDMAPAPLSPYAVSKLAGEYYVRAFHHVHGLETVCLRLFNIFGPRQNPFSEYGAAIPRFAAAMLAGERPVVFGDGKQSRDFTYVENAVEACRLAASCPPGEVAGRVFNVGCGENTTLLGVIDHLNRILGTSIEPELAPPRKGDVRHSKADVSLARKHLAYQVRVTLPEGLERLVDWMRSDQEWQRRATGGDRR